MFNEFCTYYKEGEMHVWSKLCNRGQLYTEYHTNRLHVIRFECVCFLHWLGPALLCRCTILEYEWNHSSCQPYPKPVLSSGLAEPDEPSRENASDYTQVGPVYSM